jgi:choline dehydrogenase-like flavoprotein
MVVSTDEDWRDVSQIHFYPHNEAILDALPKVLNTPWTAPLAGQLLRRLTIGLGYLPSWVSPTIRVRAKPPRTRTELPDLSISGDIAHGSQIPMFREVIRKILQAAPRLDLWPVLPMMFFSGAGKSYHFGGSFPHSDVPADGPLTTDRLGRMDQWSRVHLVDASVFPTVPATTFTLTIMANAHRIASETLRFSG